MSAIGVFDSGVGGLTVVRAVRAALPDVDILYLGDSARVPYGSKSPRTIERYALSCARFLLERDVAQLMIACNTASATALGAVREASAVPVTGAVDPGAESALAATRSGHIAVIGTLGTIGSGAYETAITARDSSTVVRAMACPLLVPLAEEGWTTGEIAEAVCRRYLLDLLAIDPQIDTLVLGCTHYPLLRVQIEEVLSIITDSAITVVDSATAMATKALAHPAPRGTGRLRCYVTDATRLPELAPRFLGHELDSFELVDL